MVLVESCVKLNRNISELIGYCVYDDIDLFELDKKTFAINMAETNPYNISSIEIVHIDKVKDIKIPIDCNQYLHFDTYEDFDKMFRIVTTDINIINILMQGKRKFGKYLINHLTYIGTSTEEMYEEMRLDK